MKETIRAYALENAIKFSGTAAEKAVIGKIYVGYPQWAKEHSDLKQIISSIVSEVNALSLEEQEKEFETLKEQIIQRTPKKKEEGLKPLTDAKDGAVVLRFAPSPSGPLHIGHAYTLGINYLYAKKYKGKIILRIEDTNPDSSFEEAYTQIPNDAQWLCENKIDEVHFQSDRVENFYPHALRFLEEGNAYICECDGKEFSELAKKSIACPCRDLPSEEHVQRWHKMLGTHDDHKYEEGQAVMRIKSDLNHKNPAMRDFPLMRINGFEHPRQGTKYRVWPLMNMAVAIDDADMGITHAIRGKDHATNAERQKIIHDLLGANTPKTTFLGRINFTGMRVSASATRALIEDGQYHGWDDPQLPFLVSLKRRGYDAGALLKFAESMGVTPNDKTVSKEEFFKLVDAHNKEAIEPHAKRFFFIEDPAHVTIEGCPHNAVELDLHPDHMKGGRMFQLNGKFILSHADLDSIEDGEIVRLIDCLNFKKNGETLTFESFEYEDFKEAGGKKLIHWLCADADNAKTLILMPNGTSRSGIAESNISQLNPDMMVQFYRFGYVRFDRTEGHDSVFYSTHK